MEKHEKARPDAIIKQKNQGPKGIAYQLGWKEIKSKFGKCDVYARGSRNYIKCHSVVMFPNILT